MEISEKGDKIKKAGGAKCPLPPKKEVLHLFGYVFSQKVPLGG